MTGYTRSRLAAFAVLLVMLTGSKWPPHAGAQSGLTLPAVNAHVDYNDQQIQSLKNGEIQDLKGTTQRNWAAISSTNDRVSHLETWEAVVDGQLILIRYGIGIMVAIFGGQLGIRWTDSRRVQREGKA